MALEPLFATSVPPVVWAILLMIVFVAVSIATVLLVRYPLRRLPPERRDEGDK